MPSVPPAPASPAAEAARQDMLRGFQEAVEAAAGAPFRWALRLEYAWGLRDAGRDREADQEMRSVETSLAGRPGASEALAQVNRNLLELSIRRLLERYPKAMDGEAERWMADARARQAAGLRDATGVLRTRLLWYGMELDLVAGRRQEAVRSMRAIAAADGCPPNRELQDRARMWIALLEKGLDPILFTNVPLRE
jgi:hypothetical protein